MNWKKIKKKYPKSFKKVNDFCFKDYFHDDEFGLPNEDRFLYDFFDDQNIVFNGGFCFSEHEGHGYGFFVMQKIAVDYAIIKPNKKVKLRYELKKAEEDAFLDAFEILEKELNKKENELERN
jgi:hypothetical protein